MPTKTGRRHHTRGPRHKHTPHYLKHYLPYLPTLLVLFIGLLFGGVNSPVNNRGVLAYATEMSQGGLLSSTNSYRSNAGKKSLSLNSKLTAAAQAKANDMVNRDYWSHNTPDGKEPWVFIQNAGYSYTKAGENLAYGFSTSSATVVGWMNSPTHKANMLDASFTEVGFGYANSSDFNNSGKETVVVAMYGKPQVLASTSENSNASAAPTTANTSNSPTASSGATQKSSTKKKTAEKKETTKPAEAVPVTTEYSGLEYFEPAAVPVTRAQLWTNGQASWVSFAIGLVSGGAILALLLHHGLQLRRLFIKSERFILHHPLFDFIAVSAFSLGYILNFTTGFIR